MIVAIAVGRAGLNMLLVASQVALSVVLPFVALPLIILTSSKSIMQVKKPRDADADIISSKESIPSTTDSDTAVQDAGIDLMTVSTFFVITGRIYI